MRKSGPFRSIRLCAYTAVGADSGVAGIVVPGGDVPLEVAEAAGWLASLVDCRCQTTNTSKNMQTDTRTARRARIQYHSMGTVVSRRIARLPGRRPPSRSELAIARTETPFGAD